LPKASLSIAKKKSDHPRICQKKLQKKGHRQSQKDKILLHFTTKDNWPINFPIAK